MRQWREHSHGAAAGAVGLKRAGDGDDGRALDHVDAAGMFDGEQGVIAVSSK
jgi:hypothetical protein